MRDHKYYSIFKFLFLQPCHHSLSKRPSLSLCCSLVYPSFPVYTHRQTKTNAKKEETTWKLFLSLSSMAQLDQAKVFIQIEEKQKRNPRKIQNMEREAKSPMSIYANVIVAVIVIVTKSSNQMSSNQTHLTSHNQKKHVYRNALLQHPKKKKKSHLHHCLSLSKRKKERKQGKHYFSPKIMWALWCFHSFLSLSWSEFSQRKQEPKEPSSLFLYFLSLSITSFSLSYFIIKLSFLSSSFQLFPLFHPYLSVCALVFVFGLVGCSCFVSLWSDRDDEKKDERCCCICWDSSSSSLFCLWRSKG